MTNNRNAIGFTLTPTEPDGDTLSYTFHNEPDLWDYVTDTLGSEYGMDATDIRETVVYGYHYTAAFGMCSGHAIGSVTAHYN